MTHVQSVPTLSLLDSVKFDNVTEEWSFAYETMSLSSDDHGQLNQYYRILYLTHSSHDIGASDTANNCLLPGTDYNHSEVEPARARERRDIRAIAATDFGMVKANATSFLRERASRAKKGGSNGGGGTTQAQFDASPDFQAAALKLLQDADTRTKKRHHRSRRRWFRGSTVPAAKQSHHRGDRIVSIGAAKRNGGIQVGDTILAVDFCVVSRLSGADVAMLFHGQPATPWTACHCSEACNLDFKQGEGEESRAGGCTESTR